MKKIGFFAMLAIVGMAIFLTGCSGSSPEAVFERYRKAALKADKENMVKFSTNSMKEAVGLAIATAMDEEGKKIFLEPMEKCEIKDDTATIKTKNGEFILKKINGKWLVDDVH